jgi:DNA-binding MarR family transcriptional regulator
MRNSPAEGAGTRRAGTGRVTAKAAKAPESAAAAAKAGNPDRRNAKPKRKAKSQSKASAPSPAAAAHPMSRHLNGLATAMRLRMRAGLLARGHDLRPSTAQVIPNLPPDGLRVTDLAARLRLTLQRTGQLVGELEEVGYLERTPDPSDGRVKRVGFTRRGRALIHDIDEITQETSALFAAKLGRERYRALCELLSELDVAVNGVDAPVRVVGAGEEDGAS